MKIISIRQPWASLIVTGGKNVKTGMVELKDVENRTWSTRYRGPVLIHASQRPDDITEGEVERRFGVRLSGKLPLGGIVGITEIIDCVRPHPSKWYAAGCYGFVLSNCRPLRFVRWKGALSLKEVPTELLHLLAISN